MRGFFSFSNLLVAMIFFFFTACSEKAVGQEFEIYNFKSGLVCPYHPKNDGGWICFETEDVYITGQGSCTYNGEERPCNWYGYEFEYSNAPKNAEFDCKSVLSKKGDFGNPKGVTNEATDTYEDSFKLKSRNGRHYVAHYSMATTSSSPNNVIHVKSSCSLDGKEVFSYVRNLIYPHVPK